MATIYGLFTDQLCWYVGSTVQTLGARAREHRCRDGGSRIPAEYDWEIKPLEACPDHVRFQRELYWFNTLNPFYSSRVPCSTRKETCARYRQVHQEDVRRRAREWARKKYALKKAAQSQNGM